MARGVSSYAEWYVAVRFFSIPQSTQHKPQITNKQNTQRVFCWELRQQLHGIGGILDASALPACLQAASVDMLSAG